MHVQTHHQIVEADADHMKLMCFVCGATPHPIVDAQRSEDGWLVTADGADDAVVATRGEAINAMLEMAVEILPDGGYSTFIPAGLAEQP